MTTTVNVAGEEPTTNELALTATVAVAPATVIGICVDLPLAVAVMVAVLVATFVVPDENVTTALPVASLVTEEADSTPVSAENDTATPDTTALEASTTVAVIVVVVLLSDATDVDEALSEIAEAVGGGVTGVVVVDEDDDPPPPQAAKRETTPTATNSEAAPDQIDFKMCSCDDGLAVVQYWRSEARRSASSRRLKACQIRCLPLDIRAQLAE